MLGLVQRMAFILGHHILKQTEKLERVHVRATKMIKELVNKTSEKRLREQGLFSLEERGLRGSITVYKYVKGCYRKDVDQLFSLENKDRTRSNRFKMQQGGI